MEDLANKVVSAERCRHWPDHCGEHRMAQHFTPDFAALANGGTARPPSRNTGRLPPNPRFSGVVVAENGSGVSGRIRFAEGGRLNETRKLGGYFDAGLNLVPGCGDPQSDSSGSVRRLRISVALTDRSANSATPSLIRPANPKCESKIAPAKNAVPTTHRLIASPPAYHWLEFPRRWPDRLIKIDQEAKIAFFVAAMSAPRRSRSNLQSNWAGILNAVSAQRPSFSKHNDRFLFWIVVAQQMESIPEILSFAFVQLA